MDVLRSDPLQKFDVFFRVKSCHVMRRRDVGPEDLHLLVEAVVQDQRVGHAQAVRLHRMAGSVMEVSHIRIVEVNNLFLGTHSHKLIGTTGLLGTSDVELDCDKKCLSL